jgi:thiamine-monophosphate kinase
VAKPPLPPTPPSASIRRASRSGHSARRPPAAEDRLLAWLRRRLRSSETLRGEGPSSETLRGERQTSSEPLIGDDAARLAGRGPWAATVDSQIAGIHHPPDLDPAVAARRLLAVNLSDLAAVGAEPAYALLALSAPSGFDHRRYFTGLLAACREHGVVLAGGDLARHPQALTATLTLLGRLPARGRWLSRKAAAPGDALWLGGTVGESAAGRLLVARGARLAGRKVELPSDLTLSPSLARAAAQAVRRHLAPTPQLALGRELGRRRRVAAIDVSDGLTLDLARLARESGVGAEIDPESLPLSPSFIPLCEHLGADPIDLALGGGEDYILLFTLPPSEQPPAAFTCTRIGTITRRRALAQVRAGIRAPLPTLGWDHLKD